MLFAESRWRGRRTVGRENRRERRVFGGGALVLGDTEWPGDREVNERVCV